MLKSYQLGLGIALLCGCLNLGVTGLARVNTMTHRRYNSTMFRPAQTYEGNNHAVQPVRYNQTWSGPTQPQQHRYNQTWSQQPYNHTGPVYNPNAQNWNQNYNQTARNWGQQSHNQSNWPQYQTTPQSIRGDVYNNWQANYNATHPGGLPYYQTNPKPIGSNNWQPNNNFSRPADSSFGGNHLPVGGAHHQTTPQPIGNAGFNNWQTNNFSAPGAPYGGNNWNQGNAGFNSPSNHLGAPSSVTQPPPSWVQYGNGMSNPASSGQQAQASGSGAAPLAPLGNSVWQAPNAGSQNAFLPASNGGSNNGVPLAPLGPTGGNQAGLSYAQGNPNAPSKPDSSHPYANLFN